jgi:hypothetical protein
VKTKEERIRSARDSVVKAAKRWHRAAVDMDIPGKGQPGKYVAAFMALRRAVAYLNKLERPREAK